MVATACRVLLALVVGLHRLPTTLRLGTAVRGCPVVAVVETRLARVRPPQAVTAGLVLPVAVAVVPVVSVVGLEVLAVTASTSSLVASRLAVRRRAAPEPAVPAVAAVGLLAPAVTPQVTPPGPVALAAAALVVVVLLAAPAAAASSFSITEG